MTANLPVGYCLRLSVPGGRVPFGHFSFPWDGTPNIFLEVRNRQLLVSAAPGAPPFLTVTEGQSASSSYPCLRVEGRSANLAQSLSTAKGLRDLEILSASPNLDLAPLTGHGQLIELCFTECGSVKDVAPLCGLRNLQVLAMPKSTTTSDLKRLREGGVLDRLESLGLRSCWELGDLSALEGLPNLHTLDLSFCNCLQDFSALATLPKLRALNMDRSQSFRDISFLRPLRDIKMLKIPCAEGCDLSVLSDKKQLEAVFIIGPVLDLQPLPVERLRELHLNGFRGKRLPARMSELQVLSLYNCGQIEDSSVLEMMETATRLTHFYGVRLRLQPATIEALRRKHPACYLALH